MEIEFKKLLYIISFKKENYLNYYYKMDKIKTVKEVENFLKFFDGFCDNLYTLFAYLKGIDNKYKKIEDINKINPKNFELDYQVLKYAQFFLNDIKFSSHNLTYIFNEFENEFTNKFSKAQKENVFKIKKLWDLLFQPFQDRSFLERVDSFNSEVIKLRDYKLHKEYGIKDFYQYFNVVKLEKLPEIKIKKNKFKNLCKSEIKTK